MTEYILRLHAETVIDPQITDPIRHSGYDLITKHDDGTVTIEVIDFTSTGWLDGAVIDLGKGNAYNISDNPDIPIYWGRPLTPEEKEQGTPEVKVLATGDNALEAFNKIKLEAALTNKIDLDYNAFFDPRVCNTATQYWAKEYIPGYENGGVFDGLSGNFYGKDGDYINAGSYEQAQKLKFINNIVEILSLQGKLEDILTEEEPYISEQYLQILQSFLSGNLMYDANNEELLNSLIMGIATFTPLPMTLIYQFINIDGSPIREGFTTASNTRSPLILDLDGDGVETIGTNSNVYFDHDDNGFAENSGWVGKDDGLLVRDLNNNGQIDDGTELFGNNSVLSSGEKAANGFEALKDLDSNNDGIFNSSDTAWNQVKVWKDANSNGLVDEGELLTLEQANVSGINLDYENSTTTDENGNQHNQTGTFIKTDGSTGSVHDVWFDADMADTIDTIDVVIPENIAALPNIKGFGNVHDLHMAMALDESGELKTLVQQYMAETDLAARDTILTNLIYHWAGVEDMDPDGRNPTQVYDNVLGDSRKLEALEEFLGEDYVGVWCWGEKDSNPHGKAAPYILQAFEELKDYAGNQLNAQSHYKNLMDNIKLVYDGISQSWTVDISSALPILQNLYTAAGTESLALLEDINAMIKSYDSFSEQVIDAFVAAGSSSGSAFEADLLNFGNFGSQGTSLSERLYGTDDDNYLNGYAGNDYIYGYDGNDLIVGGNGDDFLVGGNGADIYHFDIGCGNDSIDNTDNDVSNENPDIIRFGEGILPSYVTLVRHGYDLIVRVTYPDALRPVDSVRVLSYFDEQTTTSAAINKIQFSDEDETVWDKNYIDEHWNITPSAGGGTIAEGDDNANTLSGTSKDDVLIGNGGNDTLYADAGNDIISGGQGDDRLVGGNGDDSYLWNLGDGLDTIEEYAGRDKIVFGAGITFDDLSFEAYSGGGTGLATGLAIYVKGDKTQGIIITSQFHNYVGENQIEELHFADGSKVMLTDIPLTLHQTDKDDKINLTDNGDTVYAAGGNDTVNGGAGNDTIYGEAGNDTLYGDDGNDIISGGQGDDRLVGGNGDDSYLWNLGDGLDTIEEYAGRDKIVFGAGITFDDLSFEAYSGGGTGLATGLAIYVKGDKTQGIIITSQFHNYVGENQIEELHFADGSKVMLTDIPLTLHQTDKDDKINLTDNGDTVYAAGGNDTVNGGAGNDTIYGEAGNDTLYGDDGNDIISGGQGDDRLVGGNGDDSYLWNLGDGLDTIEEYAGRDKIVFGEGITFDDLSFTSDGYSLKITVGGNENEGMLIDAHFNYKSIETLEFSDGTTVDLANRLIQAMNSFGTDTSSTMDVLPNPTENVSDMYNLAAGSDLIKKAV